MTAVQSLEEQERTVELTWRISSSGVNEEENQDTEKGRGGLRNHDKNKQPPMLLFTMWYLV